MSESIKEGFEPLSEAIWAVAMAILVIDCCACQSYRIGGGHRFFRGFWGTIGFKSWMRRSCKCVTKMLTVLVVVKNG